MATIKSCTDLEQSKKLAEFLPLESADICWQQIYDENHMMSDYRVELIPYRLYSGIGVPCWSLPALLGVLPNPKVYQAIEGYWCCDCWKNTKDVKSDESIYIGCTKASNSIDACVAMIERLHELNLL